MAKLGYFFRIKDLQIFLNLYGKKKRLTSQDIAIYYGISLEKLEKSLL